MQGTTTAGQAQALAQCAVVFEPGDPPRTGTLAFWAPDGATLPQQSGDPGELALVTAREGTVSLCTVPVVRLSLADTLPVLVGALRERRTHRAAAFWGTATALALHLTARQRLLPGVSPGGYDAWRVGPLDPKDVLRIRELASAAPAEARAVPLPGSAEGRYELPDAEGLVRAFLDAVADVIPRTAAAEGATGRAAFAAAAPQHVPQLRAWTEEISAGLDSGVRVSLRLELTQESGGYGGSGGEAFLRAVPQIHSLADPTLVVDAGVLWSGNGHGLGPHATAETVRAVQRAAGVWPPLGRLLSQPAPDELRLTGGEIRDLLGEDAQRLATSGVEVHWPEGLGRGLAATAVVGTGTPPADLSSFLGAGRLLDFNWQLTLGGEPLTESEMDLLAEAHHPVVRLRGQWTVVHPELARKARERELKPLTPIEAISAALTGTAEAGGEEVEVAPGPWLEALRTRIADPDGGEEPIEQPAALNASLRDYQLRGLRWLDRMTSLGLGGCLADDMGLGKTITLIALHLRRQQTAETAGPTLVVCPASLLGNWQREIERFAPGTPVRRFHGPGRALEGADAGFVLTTYGTMRLDAETLGEHRWGLLVADEAQHVKNPLSSTAKSLRLIPAGARVALSGTPVENNLSELWAVLDWTTPGLLGTLRGFRSRWAGRIEAEGSAPSPEEGQGSTTGPATGPTTQRLSLLVRPFLLRRRKSDPGVAPELPPKTETDRPVELTQEQAALYEDVVRTTMAEIANKDGMARRGQVLKLLTGLKQICNHPAQYLGEEKPRMPGRSGKLALLDELVETILAENGAILVFTQYVAMARLLKQHLTDRGVPVQLLHGGTPVTKREELVRRFQDGEVPVFLLSLKAAGTGLNLTRADHVVHFDRWWNPAVEAQATDRAHRIGQTRSVQVHRLIAEGTIEDRIATMLESKQALADAVLSAGEPALTELTDSELANLVELRSTR